jgi:2-polyprenyl-3-methyl-5-hydroxy-6-metoxy-1,4-benzoquinol methylase
MTTNNRVSRRPGYFKKLYAANPDPWNFTNSTYEAAKYQATLAVLGDQKFESAFEIGCSIGILTRMLAKKCRSLLAVDIVETALTTAAENCAAFPHVSFKNLQVPAAWPAGQNFDLIVCSEVLYFLSPRDISRLAGQACESVVSGGLVLLVNYTEPVDEPCSGQQAAKTFIQATHAHFAVRQQIRQDKFRIDLLVRK